MLLISGVCSISYFLTHTRTKSRNQARNQARRQQLEESWMYLALSHWMLDPHTLT